LYKASGPGNQRIESRLEGRDCRRRDGFSLHLFLKSTEERSTLELELNKEHNQSFHYSIFPSFQYSEALTRASPRNKNCHFHNPTPNLTMLIADRIPRPIVLTRIGSNEAISRFDVI
jgi:hypothetical protein